MGESVEVGVYIPQLSMSWGDLLERSRWAEAAGVDALWLMDHLYPPGLPAVASFEGWTAATALLASTERLRVGLMVACANFRHPALLGKMATSLDIVADGRFTLGLGSGSFPLEHEQAGLPFGSFAERSDRLEETLAVVTAMFTGEPVTFEGEHVQVRDLPNLPPPLTAGGPPILVGGSGDRTLRLTARYASVWNCVTSSLPDRARTIERLHEACAAIGRDPAEIAISSQGVLALVADEADVEAAASRAARLYGPNVTAGTPAQVVDALLTDMASGVQAFAFFLHDRGSKATLDLLGAEVIPALKQA